MPKKQVTIPVFIPHHGCRHRCSFCDQRATTGTDAIPRGADVASRIESYLEKIPPSVERVEAAFFGGSFTGIGRSLQEELLGAAGTYLKQGLIHGIRVSTRPDYIDEDKLDLLAHYSVSLVELGIQSFSDEVLSASRRGHTVRDSLKALNMLKERGFDFIIQLMPGLPGDTAGKSLQSARRAREFGPKGARIYPAVVLRDTELHEMMRRGLYEPLGLEEAVELCKEMTLIFEEGSIPVIRTGLHPLETRELGKIVAGPYHPSFGFLVRSRIKRDILDALAGDAVAKAGEGFSGSLAVMLPRDRAGEFLGHRRCNVGYLKEKYSLRTLEVMITGMEAPEVKAIPL